MRLFPSFKRLVVLQKCHCSLGPSCSPERYVHRRAGSEGCSRRACWLLAAPPPCAPSREGPGHRRGGQAISAQLHKAPRRPRKRKLAPYQHQHYETSPSVLKTCRCFPKGDYKNRAFCSGQGFWTASSRAKRSVCAARSGRAPGALMLQPREPPTAPGPHLIQPPWTGDSSLSSLLSSAPSVDTTPSKAPSPQLTRGNPSSKLSLETGARNRQC